MRDFRTDNDILLTLDDVAKVLGVQRQTVVRAVRRGEIPAFKFGRQYVFSKTKLLELIRGGNTPKGPEEAA